MEPNQEITKNNIALFISNGAHIHADLNKEDRLFMRLPKRGIFKIISMLVNEGADVYAKLEDDSTPIDISILMERFNIIEYFIKNAELSLDKILFSHLKETIKLAIVKYFIEEKKIDLNAKVYNYERSKINLLHYAAIKGYFLLLKYLIEDKHADINVKAIPSNNTPVH